MSQSNRSQVCTVWFLINCWAHSQYVCRDLIMIILGLFQINFCFAMLSFLQLCNSFFLETLPRRSTVTGVNSNHELYELFSDTLKDSIKFTYKLWNDLISRLCRWMIPCTFYSLGQDLTHCLLQLYPLQKSLLYSCYTL